MDDFNLQAVKDFNFAMASDTETGYATTDTEPFTDDQFDQFGQLPADNFFQPQPAPTMPSAPPPGDVPAQNYHPDLGWWNPAGPYAPGAHYNAALGWHFPISPPRFPTAPASAFGTAILSGYGTPQEMQPALPKLSAPFNPPQQFPPPAPMFTQGPQHVPSLGVPQPPARTQSTRSSQTPRAQTPHKQPARAPSTTPKRKAQLSHRGVGRNNKKLSLDRACTCKPRPKRIGRPPNAFILYRKQTRMQVTRDLNTQDNSLISIEVGKRWHALGVDGQAPYREQAAEAKRQHELAHPGYHYAPNERAIHDFGDEACTCGAYQANVKYRAMRDAQLRKPGQAIATGPQGPVYAASESDLYAEPEELDDFDSDAFSADLPTRSKSSNKRKRAPESMDVDTPVSKRPTRGTKKGKSYAEPSDTETDVVAQPSSSRKPSSRTRPTAISTSRNASTANRQAPLDMADAFAEYEFTDFLDTTDDFAGGFNYGDIVDFSPTPSRRTSSRKSSGKTKKASTGSKGSPTRRSARIATLE
ncbi:hypothetical protein M409DRAFT_21728 [Zasmidium cellare ATCC 36951]|uniref:HMG box domain-containing protein n=1 Tax=Zasmidium cellare ATCC 36951 TaxID=1080233 RepID=A0A6A6CQ80_ZASCE|nr:uncharacterized protein M409DRAFT_21728 [Zasmidium cellare ATCC 36951]KAF2168290.1 hypothetical protein M409DRAFT_21728 [Zasmidium cellare ATCC 36951]